MAFKSKSRSFQWATVGLPRPPWASLGKFVKKRAVNFVGEKRPKSNDFGRVKPRFRRKSFLKRFSCFFFFFPATYVIYLYDFDSRT